MKMTHLCTRETSFNSDSLSQQSAYLGTLYSVEDGKATFLDYQLDSLQSMVYEAADRPIHKRRELGGVIHTVVEHYLD
jgi:hypothetical protein